MKTILCISESESVFDWARDVLNHALIADEPVFVRHARNLRWPGKPDVVLLDPILGPRRGYAVLQAAKRVYPGVPVVVLLGTVIDNYYGEADALVRVHAPMRQLFGAIMGVIALPARSLNEHPSYPPPCECS